MTTLDEQITAKAAELTEHIPVTCIRLGARLLAMQSIRSAEGGAVFEPDFRSFGDATYEAIVQAHADLKAVTS